MILSNSKGFSILQVVIATSILSAISLGVAGVMKNYYDLIGRARAIENSQHCKAWKESSQVHFLL